MVKTVSNIGSSTDKDGDEGEFIFNLEIFNDEDMTSPIDDDHVTSVGDNLYFKLSQEHPVNGLIFSIDGSFCCQVLKSQNHLFILDCTVKDQESEQVYSIVKDQCPNDFVDAVLSSTSIKGLDKPSNSCYL